MQHVFGFGLVHPTKWQQQAAMITFKNIGELEPLSLNHLRLPKKYSIFEAFHHLQQQPVRWYPEHIQAPPSTSKPF